MGMEDPLPTFSYLVSELKSRFSRLAYLHLVEARNDRVSKPAAPPEEEKAMTSLNELELHNDPLRKIWAPRPLISTGGYTIKAGLARSEKDGI
jgi:NADPH2 dehydrogenase